MPTPLLFKPSTSPSRLSPPMIPMELHALNRDKLVRSIREHLVSDSLPVTGFVVLQVHIQSIKINFSVSLSLGLNLIFEVDFANFVYFLAVYNCVGW